MPQNTLVRTLFGHCHVNFLSLSDSEPLIYFVYVWNGSSGKKKGNTKILNTRIYQTFVGSTSFDKDNYNYSLFLKKTIIIFLPLIGIHTVTLWLSVFSNWNKLFQSIFLVDPGWHGNKPILFKFSRIEPGSCGCIICFSTFHIFIFKNKNKIIILPSE